MLKLAIRKMQTEATGRLVRIKVRHTLRREAAGRQARCCAHHCCPPVSCSVFSSRVSRSRQKAHLLTKQTGFQECNLKTCISNNMKTHSTHLRIVDCLPLQILNKDKQTNKKPLNAQGTWGGASFCFFTSLKGVG